MRNEFQADIAAIGRIDTVPNILDVICRTTGMGFAAIARVTETRWIACSVKDNIAFGLEAGGELPVETTICHEVRDHRTPVIINDVSQDPVYCQHHTPALYGLQSYISVPIMLADGRFFGTLCAIDPRPHRLDRPETIGLFKMFAELIAFHLATLERLAAKEADLVEERETAVTREQFIAVLGHDLRNPLAAISAGMHLLGRRETLSSKGQDIVGLVGKSIARMSGLIDTVLDFARGRLGPGIALTLDGAVALAPTLDQVVAELRSSHPDRVIRTHIALPSGVDCDQARIAQLLSNLLGNALTHGAADQPVVVRASMADDVLDVSVANGGQPIAPHDLERIFAPFSRGAARANQDGLGLGLYIAAEIARAHEGTLMVASDAVETRFTFRMPVKRGPGVASKAMPKQMYASKDAAIAVHQ